MNIGGVDEVQRTYATLLISKIRDAAYRRANPKYPRVPYFLYCDEFQQFQTSDFDQMLSMARGFGLGLTLAHQQTYQLDSQILHAVLGNASTIVAFQLSPEDAPKLKAVLQVEDAGYLMNQPEFTARYKGADGRASWISTLKPVAWQVQYKKTGYAEYIKKRAVERYSSSTVQISYTETNTRADHAAEDPAPYNIEAGPEPRIPPFENKAKRPRPRR